MLRRNCTRTRIVAEYSGQPCVNAFVRRGEASSVVNSVVSGWNAGRECIPTIASKEKQWRRMRV